MKCLFKKTTATTTIPHLVLGFRSMKHESTLNFKIIYLKSVPQFEQSHWFADNIKKGKKRKNKKLRPGIVLQE